ncbi:MAG: hypothetical protein J6A47_05555 [Bacilli bacterium]|nr:hypothetical protein [Bacilli bacterium]
MATSGQFPQVYLYDDHLETMSHGNPLDRMGKDEFLRGKSKPLNEALIKIAINVELTDQTGKGNKDIVRAYGPEVFEFSDAFLTVKLPYNPLAMDGNEGTGERDAPVNVPVSVPVNADALTEADGLIDHRPSPPMRAYPNCPIYLTPLSKARIISATTVPNVVRPGFSRTDFESANRFACVTLSLFG